MIYVISEKTVSMNTWAKDKNTVAYKLMVHNANLDEPGSSLLCVPRDVFDQFNVGDRIVIGLSPEVTFPVLPEIEDRIRALSHLLQSLPT